MFHAVACGGHHAFDLVVFAFADGQNQRVRIVQFGGLGGHGFVVVVQQHAGLQLGAE